MSFPTKTWPAYFFLDTEFSNRGLGYPIELISLGLVGHDGRELYLVAEDKDFHKDSCNDFVKKFVLPQIVDEPRTPIHDFSSKIKEFVGEQPAQFVGYFSSMDWVILTQLFHNNGGIPRTWKKTCIDIAQLKSLWRHLKFPKKYKHEQRHSAIVDARWTKEAYYYVMLQIEMKEGSNNANEKDPG